LVAESGAGASGGNLGALRYEDWINDSLTWRDIADKLSFHHFYALAADLYGQGLMRDPNAFRKNKLWYGYGKACFRCGRMTDSLLAIKVSRRYKYIFLAVVLRTGNDDLSR
jgi:hypothetical protein